MNSLADQLKEKRLVTRSIRDKIAKRFNVSIAEIGYQDKWQRSEIALVSVAGSRKGIDKTMQSIITFIEKPPKDNSPSNLISAGLYILDPAVIDYIPDGFAMLETDVFPKLVDNEELSAYPFSGQWFDTGTPERFKKAEENWRDFS